MRSGFMALLLTLVSFGNASPDSPLKSDGRMWETYGNSSQQGMFIKAAYVQGAIEGLRVGAYAGYTSGKLDEANAVVRYAKQCVADKRSSCADISESVGKPETLFKEAMAGANEAKAKFTPQHASVLDLVHQMDKFYADYRNTPVCMITALQESINSLNGTASTEEEMEMTRKVECSQ